MTVPEQVGGVAKSAIDAMRTNPSCLAALLVVGMFVVGQWFEAERQEKRWETRMQAVVNLMNRCYPDSGEGGHP